MKITDASYVVSIHHLEDLNEAILPAVAFVGRSNVGKSTLINRLLNRKKLVKTSSTPGKTRMINLFLINRSFYFIDLPGYGFARISQAERNAWLQRMEGFLSGYPRLHLTCHLMDARREPSNRDIEFASFLRSIGKPTLVVANKWDKLKKNEGQKNLSLIKKTMGLDQLPLTHSALLRSDNSELWTRINAALNLKSASIMEAR